jgi:hypothetical protein
VPCVVPCGAWGTQHRAGRTPGTEATGLGERKSLRDWVHLLHSVSMLAEIIPSFSPLPPAGRGAGGEGSSHSLPQEWGRAGKGAARGDGGT